MANTKIEWTEKSWNPVTGCTKISSGCQNCYAERMSYRLAGRCGYDAENPFKVTLRPERLEEPLHWRKPSMIFICSMGDLFHERVPFDYVDRVFAVMALCPWHTFLILTKRPQRMADYMDYYAGYTDKLGPIGEVMQDEFGWIAPEDAANIAPPGSELPRWPEWPLPNAWLGVTVENQEMADKRIPILLQIPAAVRFVSVEPMLGPVDLEKYLRGWDIEIVTRVRARPAHDPRCDGSCRYCPVPVPEQYPEQEMVYAPRLDWVICGGETGPKARPMHPDWVRNLRDQCQEAGVPFFLKQRGEFLTIPEAAAVGYKTSVTDALNCNTIGRGFVKVGKKAAGRLLDGREWNELPEVKP